MQTQTKSETKRSKLAKTKSQTRSVENAKANVVGWGADLDPANRPGVPRDKAPQIGAEALYPDIEPQLGRTKILKSVEHMQMTPIHSTVVPPRGLSGLLRTYAFRFNEAQFAHWLTLLLADRVDVVEGIVVDLAHGKVPNIWNEMGLGAELKYNRANFQKKALIAGGVGIAAIAGLLLLRRNSRAIRA